MSALIIATVLASLISLAIFILCFKWGYFNHLEESKYIVFRDDNEHEGK